MSHKMSMLCKNKLEGKVAIITGGARGIGEATARLFADHGARMVVIADIQDELGHQVAASIGNHRCNYMHCDVADENQVKAMVDETVQNHGQLDIMFSNAGIVSGSDQTIVDLDFSAFDHLFAINARGMAACVKHAARVMVEGRVRGSIVCTGSFTSSHGGLTHTDYYMSKHAVLGLIRSASMQLGAHGIRVNSVAPGPVATPLLCQAFKMDVEEVEKISKLQMCLKSGMLKKKHIADAVLFLACDDSEFVTGHGLSVDGGLSMAFNGLGH